MQEQQVFYLTLYNVVSTPVHRPTVFSAFGFTEKAKPNKEWKLESVSNRRKWPKMETMIEKTPGDITWLYKIKFW